jgi:hypothetical protein
VRISIKSGDGAKKTGVKRGVGAGVDHAPVSRLKKFLLQFKARKTTNNVVDVKQTDAPFRDKTTSAKNTIGEQAAPAKNTIGVKAVPVGKSVGDQAAPAKRTVPKMARAKRTVPKMARVKKKIK